MQVCCPTWEGINKHHKTHSQTLQNLSKHECKFEYKKDIPEIDKQINKQRDRKKDWDEPIGAIGRGFGQEGG